VASEKGVLEFDAPKGTSGKPPDPLVKDAPTNKLYVPLVTAGRVSNVPFTNPSTMTSTSINSPRAESNCGTAGPGKRLLNVEEYVIDPALTVPTAEVNTIMIKAQHRARRFIGTAPGQAGTRPASLLSPEAPASTPTYFKQSEAS
jgi:hypothetical protein